MDTSTDGNRDRVTRTTANPPPLQFGLRSIFVVTAVAAILSAGATVGGVLGFFVGLFAICAALLLFKRKQFGVFGAFGSAVSLFMIYILPALDAEPGRSSPRSDCSCIMKQIALGLLSYAEKNGRLPPSVVCDSSGKPVHSWRTLILPEIEEGQLYSRYNFSQPWDSARNSKAVRSDVLTFHCPADSKISPGMTDYVAVIAPGSVWSVPGGAKLSDITDGPANTILLVELKNSGIKWAEPRDLDLNNLPPGITKQNLLHSLSDHPGGFNAVFADGHVEFIPETVPWADFEAMLTIAGGEKVDRSKW
jgi:prepilin-type processing-associated H-X9-DG protein